MNSSTFKNGLALVCLLSLAGCNLSNDDDDMQMPEENMPPVVMDYSATTQTETELKDKLMASDNEGDSLHFSLVEQPEYGSITLNMDGSFSYLPNLEYSGSDSFTFKVSDSINEAVTANAYIQIDMLEVSFSSYSRNAFNQAESDDPLSLNGRKFIQDVSADTAYDDLLME